MRNNYFLLLMLFASSLPSCSAILPVSYYTPIQQEGVFMGLSEPKYPIPLIGPESIVDITTPEFTISVESMPVAWAPLFLGYSVLPVIPIYPINLLIDYKYPPNDYIRMDLTLKKNMGHSERIQLKLTEVILILPDGTEIPSEKGWKWVGFPKIIECDALYPKHAGLYYRVYISEVNCFRLKIGGLSVDGKPVSLPLIEFNKAKGYRVYSG